MHEPETVGSAEPACAAPRERRAFVRLASDLVGAVRAAGKRHDVSWPGRVRDISRGGVGLIMRHRFRPATHLDLELRDRAGMLRRTVRARVAHVTPVLFEGAPSWLLGCAFETPLTDAEFAELQ